MSNSDHGVLNNFSMFMRTYPALQTLLPSAVLSKREVCSGLACGRRRGYDATLRLVRDTSLVDFLAENPLLVGGDQEEDHRARKLGLTTIASFIDCPH